MNIRYNKATLERTRKTQLLNVLSVDKICVLISIRVLRFKMTYKGL